MNRLIYAILFLSGFFGELSFALENQKENYGKVYLLDLYVQPSLKWSSLLKFDVNEAYVGFGVSATKSFSVKTKIGTSGLIGIPIWTQSFTSEQEVSERVYGNGLKSSLSKLDFIEAYGQFKSVFGTFQFGKIPIHFGSELMTSESSHIFPKSLIYSKRLFAQRDYGLRYHLAYRPFSNSFSIHHGEGLSENKDDRFLYTMSLVWNKVDYFKIGLSASTGVVVTEQGEQSIRLGGLFVRFDLYGIYALIEGFYGKTVLPDGLSSPLLLWHVDLQHPVGAHWGIQARYDIWNPYEHASMGKESQGIFGIYFASENKKSKIYLQFIKNWETLHSIKNDEVRLSWALLQN